MHDFRRVDLTYRLASPMGVTPNTQSKSWYFALPPGRESDEGWRELLHRVFHDANTVMHLREPNDANWLALDAYRITSIDRRHLLGWSGSTDPETTAAFLPWFLSRVVWEYASCYLVDEAGRYDGLDGYSFSELQLYEALDAGEVSPADAVGFLAKLFPQPGEGQKIFDARAERRRNIEVVRPTALPRKAPGAQPWVSGPVNLA